MSNSDLLSKRKSISFISVGHNYTHRFGAFVSTVCKLSKQLCRSINKRASECRMFICLCCWINCSLKTFPSMGVSFALAIITVVFTNKFYENWTGILKYSPVIQISEIASGIITSTYFVSACFSLAMLTACLFISLARFSRVEL